MTAQKLWTPDSDGDAVPDGGNPPGHAPVSRRSFLRVGAGGAAVLGLYAAGARMGPSLAGRGLLSPGGAVDAGSMMLADNVYTEVFPTSPLILKPFTDPLVIPMALRPDPTFKDWKQTPGPGLGQQNSLGNERHQKW